MTAKQALRNLSADERADIITEIRCAMKSLAQCWDHLRHVEGVLECEIETDDIEGLAGEVGCEGDGWPTWDVSDATIIDTLEGIEHDS